MPELPEVETIKEALVKSLDGATVNSVLVRNRRLRQDIPQNFEKNISSAGIIRIYRISFNSFTSFTPFIYKTRFRSF